MSELFKWLNKTEAKNPDIQETEPIAPLPAIHPVADPQSLPEKKHIQESPIAPHLVMTLTGRTEFDLELADPTIKTILDAHTLAGEQFRFLRTRLGQLQKQNGLNKLLITSSVPEEGKTFVACSLAGILAQEQGKRVLLVDADLRKPSTAKSLGIETMYSNGLAQVLQNKQTWTESLLRTPHMGFFYLPAGQIPENPSELLASNNLETIIHEMQEQFDWIIIDSPPVLTVADPSRLAPICNSVLFIVRANKTPAKMVEKSIQMLGKDLLCGIVLNRARTQHSSRYYYHYYTESGKRIK
jgi:capsular exopolysaccharide synthesis family protein